MGDTLSRGHGIFTAAVIIYQGRLCPSLFQWCEKRHSSNFSKWRRDDTGTREEIAVNGTAMNRPSVDQVRTVINSLYDDSNPGGKEKASEWLQELQRSVSAWHGVACKDRAFDC